MGTNGVESLSLTFTMDGSLSESVATKTWTNTKRNTGPQSRWQILLTCPFIIRRWKDFRREGNSGAVGPALSYETVQPNRIVSY
jgi:hypothetical protein